MIRRSCSLARVVDLVEVLVAEVEVEVEVVLIQVYTENFSNFNRYGYKCAGKFLTFSI